MYRVILLPSAIGDIDDIHIFIARQTGPLAADGIQAEMQNRIANLATFPERGNVPKELASMGRADHRELHFKPYRIFYRVLGSIVEVTAVLDGRRDMNTLIRQRLTR